MVKILVNSQGKAITHSNKALSLDVSKKKYGLDIDAMIGNPDANGVLQFPTADVNIVFDGIEDITTYGLYYKFYGYAGLTGSISFPDLEDISGLYACYNTFYSTGISEVLFPSLTTVSGIYAAQSMFSYTPITSVSFPALVSVTGNSGMRQMFQNCENLTSALFPELTTVSGQMGLGYIFSSADILTLEFPKLSVLTGVRALFHMFDGCKNLTSVSFPALTTDSFGTTKNQFEAIFNITTGQTSGAITMHFPSNLESIIQGMTGYPTFGATSGIVTLAFDLPATS